MEKYNYNPIRIVSGNERNKMTPKKNFNNFVSQNLKNMKE